MILIVLMGVVFLASNFHLVYHHDALVYGHGSLFKGPSKPGVNIEPRRLRQGNVVSSESLKQVSLSSSDETSDERRFTHVDLASLGANGVTTTVDSVLDHELDHFRKRFHKEMDLSLQIPNNSTTEQQLAVELLDRVEAEASSSDTREIFSIISTAPAVTPAPVTTGFSARRFGLASVPQVQTFNATKVIRGTRAVLFDQVEEIKATTAHESELVISHIF